MGTTSLRKAIRNALSSRSFNYENVEIHRGVTKLDRLFLPYQLAWINDDSNFAIAEKCRQSGLSTAQAFRAVLLAINGIKGTCYSTYSLPATKNFIKRCANIARAFNYGYRYITGKELINECLLSSYKIAFPNGLEIEAIAGNPTNLRDKPGRELVIDEAAFRIGGLQEILKAGKANLLWGTGSIRIISTHNGEDNDFNYECRKLENDSSLGSLHKITFRDAIRQGLYKQICAVSGKQWSQDSENEWIDSWYRRYGDECASEELDVIPRRYGSSLFFKPEYFHRVRIPQDVRQNAARYRGWDLAATDKAKAKSGTFYTVNLLVLHHDDTIYVIDGDARQLGATEGDEWIRQTALKDSRDTVVLIEQEPGSTGIKYIEFMDRYIPERSVQAYTPTENKNIRAMPLAPALKQRLIVFDEDMDDETFERIKSALCGFDGKSRPLVSDFTDCLSMIYAHLSVTDTSWLSL
jgi:phage terminase large subunit-like protein